MAPAWRLVPQRPLSSLFLAVLETLSYARVSLGGVKPKRVLMLCLVASSLLFPVKGTFWGFGVPLVCKQSNPSGWNDADELKLCFRLFSAVFIAFFVPPCVPEAS